MAYVTNKSDNFGITFLIETDIQNMDFNNGVYGFI